MAPPDLVLFLLGAFGAEVIGTMAGFGAATVLTPLASWFVEIKTAVALVAVFHLFGNASRLYFFGRHIRWRLVGPFGLIGVVCAFGGAQLAAWWSPALMRFALGSFLLVYVIAEATHLTTMRVAPTTRTLLIGGALSGVIAGVIGTGGAIRSACLLAFGLPKEAYLGTSALIALLVDATRLPVYVSQQFIPPTYVPLIVALTVVAFGGAWLGQRLIRRVSAERFHQLVLAMLFLMGIKLIADSVLRTAA